MNIIKGIDRIAIMLAVVAIIPSFILGANYYDKYDREKKDNLKGQLIENFLLSDIPDKNLSPEEAWELAKPEKPSRFVFEDTASTPTKDPLGLFEKLLPEKDQRFVKYAPWWHLIIAGIASSISTFLIVVFSVCGISRVLKHISLWIVDGFKDENKPKNNP